MNKITAILILILIMASGLRLYGLDHQSLWEDELSSWARSHYSNLNSVIKNGVMSDVHPPGYHMVVYFVEKYIGNNETALRLPSAISGILSVLVIFFLGVRLYSYREGLIASAMTAVLWCPVYFSQEGRAYSMLLLFTLLSTYFWVTMLMRLNEEKKISIYLGSGYVLSAAVATYLHYFGLFLIILQAFWSVVFFIRKPRALLTFFIAYFFVLIAYIPSLTIMVNHLQSNNISDNLGWIKPPGNIIVSFCDYLKYIFNGSLKFVILAVGMYVYLFFLILFKLFIHKKIKNIENKSFPIESLLFLWLIVPFTVLYIKSVVSYPVLIYRGLIISLPAAYLLLSRAITQLFKRPIYQAIITVMIIAYGLYWLISDGYYVKPTKEQFREAAYTIADNDKYYKNSLIIGYAWNLQYFNYYLMQKGSVKRVNIMAGDEKDIPQTASIINKVKPEYVWYIFGHRDPDDKYLDFMKKRLSLIKKIRFIDTGVILFKNIDQLNRGI